MLILFSFSSIFIAHVKNVLMNYLRLCTVVQRSSDNPASTREQPPTTQQPHLAVYFPVISARDRSPFPVFNIPPQCYADPAQPLRVAVKAGEEDDVYIQGTIKNPFYKCSKHITLISKYEYTYINNKRICIFILSHIHIKANKSTN